MHAVSECLSESQGGSLIAPLPCRHSYSDHTRPTKTSAPGPMGSLDRSALVRDDAAATPPVSGSYAFHSIGRRASISTPSRRMPPAIATNRSSRMLTARRTRPAASSESWRSQRDVRSYAGLGARARIGNHVGSRRGRCDIGPSDSATTPSRGMFTRLIIASIRIKVKRPRCARPPLRLLSEVPRLPVPMEASAERRGVSSYRREYGPLFDDACGAGADSRAGS
jgi:hypothetical protein